MAHDRRKADHIRINLEEEVQFPRLTTGFEHYRLQHQALPELDLRAVNTGVALLGKTLRLPLVISSMTGGTTAAAAINRTLAEAAQMRGVAMGLGSQRAGIEQPETAYTFQVRDVAPAILLFANLGAVQLNRGYGVDHCRRAVDMIGADALILHVNPLQEALQADGDWDWRGVLGKIERICRDLGAPVVVKEVGWGVNEQLARQLADVGVAAIDVAGAGGTSWSAVESYRATTEARRQLCLAFADWGIPTAETLRMARRGAPNTPLIASGGLRTGIDAAKALALGASAVGIASPFLKAATLSVEEVVSTIDAFTDELRIAMFCSGAGAVATLRESGRIERV